MGFKSVLRVVGSGAAALFMSLAGPGWAMAGDITAPPSLVGTPRSYTAFDSPPITTAPPVHAAPVLPAAVMPFATVSPGCTTCQTKGGLFSKHRPCNGRAMSINPDSCFGFYFTQWSRWEDVCPMPAPPGIPAIPPTPRTPVAPKPEKTGNSDAPLPRPAPVPMPSIPKP
jgi:hypothetical protein